MSTIDAKDWHNYLVNFVFNEKNDLFSNEQKKTQALKLNLNGREYDAYVNEFWTSRQRQMNSIHEISYRACFKPQLPEFFIKKMTRTGDTVYDPFSGRGTTVLAAALEDRNIISNDINPLSEILVRPRLFIPELHKVEDRLDSLEYDKDIESGLDLSMFYHPKTEAELASLRNYLIERKSSGKEDHIDRWIRMVATNRLTGHSRGFFSVYTLPPNQAVSQKSQIRINKKRDQKPEYRDTKKLIMKKSKSLLKNMTLPLKNRIKKIGERALFISKDAGETSEIQDHSVDLTVTSPPFLDVVQYDADNWLRCWFNGLDAKNIARGITMSTSIDIWCDVMISIFRELYRITRPGGYVAFEVGEVKRGKLNLEEYVLPMGRKTGFHCAGIMINRQNFTKTANIWGIENNKKGTNSNRIVILQK